MKKDVTVRGISRCMFLVFLSTVLFLSLSTTGLAADKVIQWKLQDTYESVSVVTQTITNRFIKTVEQVTNGKVKITRFEPGAFVNALGAFDGLSKGMYDAAAFYPGYYVGKIPLANVEQGLPFGWTEQEVAYVSYQKFGLEDLLRKEYAKHNIFWVSGGTLGDIYNVGSTKPIRKLADAKGMKVRAIGVYGNYVRLMGAAPVVIPSGELYMGLKLGTIDGMLGSPYYYETHKLGEVLKYYLMPSTNRIGFNISVNMDSWNKLPDEYKPLIKEAARRAFWAGTLEYRSRVLNITYNININKYGVEYTTLPQEEQEWLIKETQKKIWPGIAKLDAACAKGVEIVRKSREYLGLTTAD